MRKYAENVLKMFFYFLCAWISSIGEFFSVK